MTRWASAKTSSAASAPLWKPAVPSSHQRLEFCGACTPPPDKSAVVFTLERASPFTGHDRKVQRVDCETRFESWSSDSGVRNVHERDTDVQKHALSHTVVTLCANLFRVIHTSNNQSHSQRNRTQMLCDANRFARSRVSNKEVTFVSHRQDAHIRYVFPAVAFWNCAASRPGEAHSSIGRCASSEPLTPLKPFLLLCRRWTKIPCHY